MCCCDLFCDPISVGYYPTGVYHNPVIYPSYSTYFFNPFNIWRQPVRTLADRSVRVVPGQSAYCSGIRMAGPMPVPRAHGVVCTPVPRAHAVVCNPVPRAFGGPALHGARVHRFR